ncbi:MAG: AAA family ATPase, partial [Endomicrobiales bacterium]
RIVSKVSEKEHRAVYRVKDRETKTDFSVQFIKLNLRRSYAEDLIRFKREIENAGRLDHAGIVRVCGGGEHQGTPYVVRELFEWEDLAEFMDKGHRFSAAEAAHVTAKLCEGLSYLHGKGVIHGALRPGNVIIRREGGEYQVKLQNFGISLLGEMSEADEREALESFRCIAPEATGILNKRIDERSDLYSLGVVFYRLLTGEMPFKGNEVRTLLHQQVARVAESPAALNAAVPGIMDRIVMKLLSKEPDLRYQSARGLLYDLERAGKGEGEFIPGEKDKKSYLNYSTRLAGREEESSLITKAFRRAAEGGGSICFIGGEAGIGKSRLVEELRGHVYEQGGIFVGGRCFDQENKIPYQPFRDVISEYVNLIGKLDAEDREKEKERIKGVLGDLGGIMVQMNPRMRELLGDVPEIVPLDPERENQRFLMVSSKFFCAIVEKGKGCALFLDDLQWADEGSLNLLREIAEKIGGTNVLLLGTYRREEVGEKHSFNRIKRLSGEDGYPVQDIALKPLDHEALNRVVSGILGEREERTHALARYVLEKSKGNSFFAINVIRELVEGKGVVWEEEGWREDWDKINNMTVSEDMIDMILRRIEGLGEDQNQLLCLGAVIGREFETRLLYRLLDMSPEHIIRLIDEAITKQLLEESAEKGKLLFIHDRIREAFYRRIGKDEERKLHLRIARTIEEMCGEKKEAVLFDLAHHYTEGGDKDKSLEYVLPAAAKAKGEYANEEATKYYRLGIDILEEKGRAGTPAWIRAHEELVEVYLVIGKGDEAIEILKRLLGLKKSDLEKARIYRMLGSAWFIKANLQECEACLASGLRLLGERVPATRTETMVFLLREFVIHLLHAAFPALFKRKVSGGVKAEHREQTWLYHSLVWAYTLFDARKQAFGILRNLNIVESRIGQSKELGVSIAEFGGVCMALALFDRALEHYGKALEIRRALNDRWGEAQNHKLTSYCYLWRGDYASAVPSFQRTIGLFEKIEDMWELGLTVNGLGQAHRYLANYDKSLEYILRYLKISETIKDNYGIGTALDGICSIHIFKGDFEKAEEFGKKALALTERHRIWFVNCVANGWLGYMELERQDYGNSIEYLERAKQLNEENEFLKEYTVHAYPLLADAFIGRFSGRDRGSRGRERKAELRKIRKACDEARRRTRSWPNHYGQSLRVTAKYYALAEKHRKAVKYFRGSIEHIAKLGQRYELARSYYEYGRYLLSSAAGGEGRAELERAYGLFCDLGSPLYMQRCVERLGLRGGGETDESGAKLKMQKRMSAVLETNKYLSSISRPEDMLEKLVDRTLELVGAERGILFLYPAQGERKLEIKAVRQVKDEEIESAGFQAVRNIVSLVEKERKRLIIDDANDKNELNEKLGLSGAGLKSVLCVPVIAKGDIVGIFYLDNRLVKGLFDKEDLWIMDLLSSQAAVAIRRAMPGAD